MRIQPAIVFAAAVSAALTLTAHAQTTYYVNGSCGSDAWTGTSAVCVAPNGPKRTIQAGIDTSVTSDTVIVADGTYTGFGNRDLDFGGRNIHLRSESLDPALCIIDCQGTAANPHRGFYFHSGETNQAMVEGFTITGAYATGPNQNDDQGAGVFCDSSSPTIAGCILSNNTATGFDARGGALASLDAAPVIRACRIVGNRAHNPVGSTQSVVGGAIFGLNSTLTLIDSTISNNTASNVGGIGWYNALGGTVTNCVISNNSAGSGNGGGLTLSAQSGFTFTITDCSITANTATGGVGGITFLSNTEALVVRCTIEGNSSVRSLGGINGSGEIVDSVIRNNHSDELPGGIIWGGTMARCMIVENTTIRGTVGGVSGFNLDMKDCVVARNRADGPLARAGGVSLTGVSTITNCLVTDNVSGGTGGGIGCLGDTLITGCTLSGNSAAIEGGAVACVAGFRGSIAWIQNTVAWGNDAPAGPEISVAEGPRAELVILTVSHSDISGGQSAVLLTGRAFLFWDPGNIDLDPLFVDPANGDYHAQSGSPVIDAGDNTAVPAGVTTDLDGNPRFVNEIVDMGAYEFQGESCYADCDGSGTLDIFDFLCFQNSFVAGDPYACDCDPDPVCDIFDFLCFQTAFVSGCP